MPTVVWVVVAVLLAAMLLCVLIYNSLVWKLNRVKNVFASVDVMLKQRCDLIPNLVAAVKGYAAHEKQVFERITELRNQAVSPNLQDGQKIDLDRQMTGAIGQLLAVVENYPELKASSNFMHLQRSLSEVEEQIAAARRAYNASVLEYNNSCEMLPSNIFAQLFGFKKRAFFQAGVAERDPVNIKLS